MSISLDRPSNDNISRAYSIYCGLFMFRIKFKPMKHLRIIDINILIFGFPPIDNTGLCVLIIYRALINQIPSLRDSTVSNAVIWP